MLVLPSCKGWLRRNTKVCVPMPLLPTVAASYCSNSRSVLGFWYFKLPLPPLSLLSALLPMEHRGSMSLESILLHRSGPGTG